MEEEEVRVVVCSVEERTIYHDFEREDPTLGEHAWNHWREADSEGGFVRTPALLLRAEWQVQRDRSSELLSRFDVLALIVRDRVYPSDLCRPEMLRAVVGDRKEARYVASYERMRECHSKVEELARQLLDSYESQVRAEEPIRVVPIHEAISLADMNLVSAHRQRADEAPPLPETRKAPRRRK